MNDTLLMVMNPRAIPECIDAIRELRGVDKAWMQYMTEIELVDVVARIIANTKYERYMILSDDCVPSQRSLDLVLDVHAENPDGLVCAWINVDNASDRTTVHPTPLRDLDYPTEDSYAFLTIDEVGELPREPLRVYFHGCNLAVMNRDLWDAYPFGVYDAGFASDYHQCVRLQLGGVPIWTHPDALVYHVKEVQNQLDKAPEKQLLIGKRAPRVTIERETPWAG